MPTKKSKKQVQLVKQKQQVKQVVNVNLKGVDIKAKRKQVKRVARLPEPAPTLLRQGPPINVSLSTQSYTPSQPSYLNEYNTLLRQLAEERTIRQRSDPPLAANTSPLTTNQQKNELLNRVQEREAPELPVANALPISLANVVAAKLYDDPLTNENMFINSSRLGENLSQKLPNSNFDYKDVNNYDAEDEKKQNALEEQVFKSKEAQSRSREPSEDEQIISERPKKQSGSDSLIRKKNEAYSNYILFINDINQRYNMEEKIKPQSQLNTLSGIKDEIKKINSKLISKEQLTIPMFKKG